MSAMSDYLEETFLKAVLNGVAFPSLPSIWVGLALTTAFTDSSFASEASGADYARVQMTAGWTITDIGSGQWQGKNTNPIVFPPANGDYSGPVVGWGLFSASSGDYMLIHSSCTSKVIVSGNTVYIEAGALIVEAR